MSVSKARAIAFDILRRVETEGAYASDLLHSELNASNIKAEDAALATELTLGVLRWQRLLDFLLQPHAKKSVERLDLPVALALRLGLYQLYFLSRVPARSAVNESVELVKRARKSSAGSLVNAVLRRAAENNATKSTGGALNIDDRLEPNTSLAERIAIAHSHPTWLVERWLSRFGDARTLALLEANNRAPRLTCAVNDAQRREEIVAALAASGLRVEPGALLKDAITVSGGSITQSRPFQRGAISIQDEASQAIPLLLDVQPGQRVLDLCAAPGGKTPALVRAAGPAALVIAADRHEHRLRAMREQFRRVHIESRFPGETHGSGSVTAHTITSRYAAVRIVELDAAQPLPFGAKFDRILVDAPCSGTGTLARHPEIRWRLKPEQLREFHALQVAILRSALHALAPGGRLVYSTCSLEREENEDVIADALREFSNVTLAPTAEVATVLNHYLAPYVDAASILNSHGFFRTFPGETPTDGFFAAVVHTGQRAPIERDLEFVASEDAKNAVTTRAHERFANSRARIKGVYGKLEP